VVLQYLLAYCLCTTQPTDRMFTSITSLCLPPPAAQNSLSLSSHYSPISSNGVTLLYEGAGTGIKQDRAGGKQDVTERRVSQRTGNREACQRKHGGRKGVCV